MLGKKEWEKEQKSHQEIRISGQILGWGPNLNVIWQSWLFSWFFSRSVSNLWVGGGTPLEMTAYVLEKYDRNSLSDWSGKKQNKENSFFLFSSNVLFLIMLDLKCCPSNFVQYNILSFLISCLIPSLPPFPPLSFSKWLAFWKGLGTLSIFQLIHCGGSIRTQLWCKRRQIQELHREAATHNPFMDQVYLCVCLCGHHMLFALKKRVAYAWHTLCRKFHVLLKCDLISVMSF